MWLLGLPQFFLTYLIFSLVARGGGGLAVTLLFLLISGVLAAHGVCT